MQKENKVYNITPANRVGSVHCKRGCEWSETELSFIGQQNLESRQFKHMTDSCLSG